MPASGDGDAERAARLREQIDRGECTPELFAASLAAVTPRARDAWIDRVLGLCDLSEDGPALPPGCTPYLPVGVGTLSRVVEGAVVTAADTFVDVGSGVGRAVAIVHLLTGARAIGIEVQPQLVREAKALTARIPSIRYHEGDAAELMWALDEGTVFFLYAPFDADRMARLLDALERIARERPIRLACVNVPTLSRPWLRMTDALEDDLTLYQSLLPADGAPSRTGCLAAQRAHAPPANRPPLHRAALPATSESDDGASAEARGPRGRGKI